MKKGMACLLALVMALALTACTRTAQPQNGGDAAPTDPTVPAEPDAGYNTGAGEVVQIKGFRSINIEWVSGAVNVELYDGEGIQLSETMLDGGDVALKMEWRVDEDDNTLDIRSQPLTVSASQKKQLTVKLPRSTVLHELNIDAVSADVSVDLTEEDTLTLTELDVSSVSGTVSVHAANAGEISLETTSGDITLTLARQPEAVAIDFHTVSGQLRSDVTNSPDAPAVWKLETVSGNADIFLMQ